MESTITLFSVSDKFIASEITTIGSEYFDTLKKFFRLKNDCRFVVCTGLDHTQKAVKLYSYNFYEILDSEFSPITQFEGIYKLDNNKLIEGWTEKWGNKSITVKFHSDIFDKYQARICSNSDDKLKIVQQIAIVLQFINDKSTKFTENDSEQIRISIDNFLKTKRI